jgi:hypothetical protein
MQQCYVIKSFDEFIKNSYFELGAIGLPVILAILEAEIKRIVVECQSWADHETLS